MLTIVPTLQGIGIAVLITTVTCYFTCSIVDYYIPVLAYADTCALSSTDISLTAHVTQLRSNIVKYVLLHIICVPSRSRCSLTIERLLLLMSIHGGLVTKI